MRAKPKDTESPTPKTKRVTDPDVARLRAVKGAAAKYTAARAGRSKAIQRESDAKDALLQLINEADEALRHYLMQLAGIERV